MHLAVHSVELWRGSKEGCKQRRQEDREWRSEELCFEKLFFKKERVSLGLEDVPPLGNKA